MTDLDRLDAPTTRQGCLFPGCGLPRGHKSPFHQPPQDREPGTYRTPEGGVEIVVGIEESASWVEDQFPDEVEYLRSVDCTIERMGGVRCRAAVPREQGCEKRRPGMSDDPFIHADQNEAWSRSLDAARAAAPPVEPTPEWQWTDPEQTNAGPRSPDPVPGLREALLLRIRDETRAAVIEGDASDCSSPDCIADAVYEIVRAALLASDKPGLDAETGRRIGEACASQGHITDDAPEDMALAVAAEYARLSEGAP